MHSPSALLFLTVLLFGLVMGNPMEAHENVLKSLAACQRAADCFGDISTGSGSTCDFPRCPDGYQYSQFYDDTGATTSECVRSTFDDPSGTLTATPFTSVADCLQRTTPASGPGVGYSRANFCLGRFLEANQICMESYARSLF
eukprot:CAMPEP_0201508352 /NCGR_PEP_ID=MMETSP0161_2-20130828/1747_1 /ASSEMBLY_ACC=CAM_ASM_000251 /TAXON_ID=180227 /ORGANISM="Neoparamoeba aestuarina, Strain SoJaBio B1-5/56/2" /LENGTH=142 /DNA_ID=CAMNT_0047902991 /DNA_START=29 /DNA_END=457 /DNA_ORIENTATION=-